MAISIVECDVVVVGGGGAGLRAAISARRVGARTILVNKGTQGKSGATIMAGADLTADGRGLRGLGFFGEPRDSPETFFSDIVHQGFYLNNQPLVETYVRHAPDRIKELLDWGLQVKFSEERAVFTSGLGISKALLQRAKAEGVEFVSDVMILDLLTEGEKTAGVLGLNILTGEIILFKSKAVVLATGGWHKAYAPNTGARDLAGDGPALAYRAGAVMANMEFITFCCNVLLWPQIWQGSIFTYVASLLFGGRLINCKRETFLDQYDPYVASVGTSTEWNKSFVSFATTKEVFAGRGSPHGGVFFDNGDVPLETFVRRAVTFYPGWKYHAADFSLVEDMLRRGEPVEVGAAVEYFEGGVAVDERFATNIEGLYAAGECAASLFGANRVAAATTEMLVTGAVAGTCAGEYARATRPARIHEDQLKMIQDEILRPVTATQGIRPAEVRGEVQRSAHANLGPIRTQVGLQEFLALLRDVQNDSLPVLSTTSKSRTYNKEWVDALELRNMVQLLDLSAQSALRRTESRGVHYRSDFPNTDNDHWLVEITAVKQSDRIKFSMRPVITSSLVPPRGAKPYLEMMKSMMQAHSAVGGHH